MSCTEPPDKEVLEQVEGATVSNARSQKRAISQEPMRPETERVLRAFFRPFNSKLAELLHDTRFLWEKEELVQEVQVMN